MSKSVRMRVGGWWDEGEVIMSDGQPNGGFIGAIKECLTKYSDFSGRASRSEYWYSYLALFLLFITTIVLDATFGTTFWSETENGTREWAGGTIGCLAFIATLLPSIAVAARRLHDVDRSGWWILINLVPLLGIVVFLYLTCQAGVDKDNIYGPPPKYFS